MTTQTPDYPLPYDVVRGVNVHAYGALDRLNTWASQVPMLASVLRRVVQAQVDGLHSMNTATIPEYLALAHGVGFSGADLFDDDRVLVGPPVILHPDGCPAVEARQVVALLPEDTDRPVIYVVFSVAEDATMVRAQAYTCPAAEGDTLLPLQDAVLAEALPDVFTPCYTFLPAMSVDQFMPYWAATLTVWFGTSPEGFQWRDPETGDPFRVAVNTSHIARLDNQAEGN